MLAQPAGAFPVGQGEKGVHILTPRTKDACKKAQSNAPGQLYEAEFPPLPSLVKGINPIQCQAVSLARSTGKQVVMYVRHHGRPEAGATDVTVVARPAASPPSLVGRSSTQPTNQTLRVSLWAIPTTCPAVENTSCHHFPEHARRSPWGVTK